MPKNVVCKNCNNLVNDWCEKVIDSPDPDVQRDCPHFHEKTNADRIRKMNDEELAMFLCNFRSYNADVYICEGCKAEQYCHAGHTGTIDWLQQPAEEADNETVGERKDGYGNG